MKANNFAFGWEDDPLLYIQSGDGSVAQNIMDYNVLWKAALAEIELAIPRASFVTWFKETSVAGRDDGAITISVPNGFAKEWLQSKYNKHIVRALRNVGGETVREINYVIGKSAADAEAVRGIQKRRPLRVFERPEAEETLLLKDIQVDPETGLNPRYTFENFVVGSFNDMAYAASQAVIKNLGSAYNPLFIFGGVGLGKTHLLQAIGNEILKTRPGTRVKYVTCEKYVGEIVEAIATHTFNNQAINQVKERYRKTDLLIVDDIHFISGKEKMQEEFFHTFNALHQQNKQIVIASDRPPSAIPALESRLRSRFDGGMTAPIDEPDLETRLAILKTKADQKGVSLPDESLRYIATNIKSSIRDLEGALNRIVLSTKMSSLPPTAEETKRILEQLTQAPKRFTSPKKVIKTVADFYEIMEKDLVNSSRRKEIVRPRQIAMYILREELHCSYPFIGERLGKKDHTTAIHACRKIEGELKSSADLQNEIKAIREKIYSA